MVAKRIRENFTCEVERGLVLEGTDFIQREGGDVTYLGGISCSLASPGSPLTLQGFRSLGLDILLSLWPAITHLQWEQLFSWNQTTMGPPGV